MHYVCNFIADRIQLIMIGQRISLMMFVLLLSYHSRVTNGQQQEAFSEYTVYSRSVREVKHYNNLFIQVDCTKM